MTERFVTFNLNKLHKSFKKFYPVSREKTSIAQKVLKPEIVEKYIRNINKKDSKKVIEWREAKKGICSWRALARHAK